MTLSTGRQVKIMKVIDMHDKNVYEYIFSRILYYLCGRGAKGRRVVRSTDRQVVS